MSEIIPAPKKGRWAVHPDRTAADLKSDLATSGYRLISIKSYVQDGRRLYAACSVENAGVTTNWTAKIPPDDLRARLTADGNRLISLDAFIEDGKLFCAAVWVKNDGRFWDWNPSVSEANLRESLGRHFQLTCLRVFRSGGAPTDPMQCAAIWTKSDGRDWDWRADIDFDGLYYRLKNGPLNGQSLVSYDSFSANGKTRYAYVTWKDAASDGWYYRTPVPGLELTDQVRGLCCYPFDVCRTYPSDFGIVQYAYPPTAHPNAKTLVTFEGTGTVTAISDDFIQWNLFTTSAKHKAGNTVTIRRAVRFYPGAGGWCAIFDRDSWSPPDPGKFFCAPPTGISPGTSHTCPNLGWGYTTPIAVVATQVEATDGTFKQQEFVTIPLAAAGSPAPAPVTDLVPPAYVGLQGPLEILQMTDDRRVLELKGQVVNFAGRAMKISGIHLDLLDPAGNSVYHADLPLEFKLDFDEDANASAEVDYDKTNPKHLLTPLPRFRHLIEVPGGYTGGSLEIVLHIQTKNFYDDADPDDVIGTMECFHSRRVLPVAEGAVLRIASPVKGLHKWGSGPAASSWHAHWYPMARYAYDIVKVDDNHGELQPGTDGKRNADSLSWDDEIHSASDGKVIFVHDSEVDHLPDAALTPPIVHPGTANEIIIRDGNTRYLYAHVKQGSAGVAVGDHVTTGQVIGLVGNNGHSSGAHLHFGVFTHEPIGTTNAVGVLRPLAVSVSPRTVAVPVDGAYLDTP